MSTNKIDLLQFKIQCHLVYQKTYFEEKSLFCTISVAILLFSHQTPLTDLVSWVLMSLIFVIKSLNEFQNGLF